jgi:hypothetical protein
MLAFSDIYLTPMNMGRLQTQLRLNSYLQMFRGSVPFTETVFDRFGVCVRPKKIKQISKLALCWFGFTKNSLDVNVGPIPD